MKRVLSLTLILMLTTSTAQAELLVAGGVSPADPSTWGATTDVILGYGSNGYATINTDAGGTYPGTSFTWNTLHAGWNSGKLGGLIVTGSGASLNLAGNLYNGVGGATSNCRANIQILDGASMTVAGNTQLAGKAYNWSTLTIDNATFNNQLTHIGTLGTAYAFMRNGAVWNAGGDRWNIANGATSTGGLTIESTGGTVNVSSALGIIWGNAEGASATVSLDGASSAINYTSNSSCYLGHIGSAALTMDNNSSIDLSGDPSSPCDVTLGTWGASDSSAILSSGSQLTVGDDFTVANGNKASVLTIQGGSSVTVGDDISIGDGTRNASSGARGVESHAAADQLHGTVTVTGSGSTMSAGGDLQLGAHLDTHSFPHSIETVVMNIDNSAVVTAGGSTLVGQGTASVDATLDFDGGTLNTASLGADMANITGTGTINTKGLVGNTALSIASAGDLNQTLSNGGSVTINLDIDGTGIMGAGYDGTGSLTVSGGVNLTSTGGMLGYCWGSDGTATIAGSGTVWEATDGLSVGGMGAGTLTIKDGAMVKTGALVIDGDVAKDAASGFDSYYYYVNYSGTYAGDPSDQFDIATDSVVKISNGGMLALPGNLTIGMGMSDVLGAILGSDELEIMDVSGAWVDGASAVRNTDYTLTYDSGMGYTILTAVAQNWTPGDANKDGKVDSSDLGLLANNWQAGIPSGDPANVTWNKGDFNFDYKVDSSDLGLLANNWQFGVDMGAPNVVPEPSMLILLLGTMLIGWALRKK